jgi:peptidylprolyl isomerase
LRRSVRVVSAALAGLLLAGAGLSACADGKKNTADPSASPTAAVTMPAATGGTVKVTGDAKVKPVISLPKPFHVDKTTVNVISKGTGAKLAAGQLARIDYVGLNATTGVEFDSSWKRSETSVFPLTEGGLITGFLSGLVGQQVGSRVEVSVAPADAYPEGNPDINVLATDSLVFVLDIRDSGPLLTKASGKTLAQPAGFPTVTVKDGIPTAVAAETTAATATKSAVLVQGTGTTVAKGKFLAFNYIATTAKDGKLFDNSFSTQPITIPSVADDLGIPGLAAALTGQKVGSRVIVVAPKALASTTATPPPGVTADDTIVFVVDILGVL